MSKIKINKVIYLIFLIEDSHYIYFFRCNCHHLHNLSEVLINDDYFKDLNNFINYYSFIKKNEILFINVYNILNEINDKKIIKFKNKIIDKISKKLNFSFFSMIKSEEDLINFLTTIIILKTFSKQSIYNNNSSFIINKKNKKH